MHGFPFTCAGCLYSYPESTFSYASLFSCEVHGDVWVGSSTCDCGGSARPCKLSKECSAATHGTAKCLTCLGAKVLDCSNCEDGNVYTYCTHEQADVHRHCDHYENTDLTEHLICDHSTNGVEHE